MHNINGGIVQPVNSIYTVIAKHLVYDGTTIHQSRNEFEVVAEFVWGGKEKCILFDEHTGKSFSATKSDFDIK